MVFDVAKEGSVNVEQELAAAMARAYRGHACRCCLMSVLPDIEAGKQSSHEGRHRIKRALEVATRRRHNLSPPAALALGVDSP